ncbi:class-II aminoacyl-tRNA synthetase family protein, partial [Staphylococcus epidermidis]
FVSKNHPTDFTLQNPPTIQLLIPITQPHSTLPQTLLPHLIHPLSYNLPPKNTNLNLYQIRPLFFPNPQPHLPHQLQYFTPILTPHFLNNTSQGNKHSVHFCLTNPLVQPIPQNLNLQFHFTARQIHPLHPPTTAILSLNGKHIPFIPQLHPTLA